MKSDSAGLLGMVLLLVLVPLASATTWYANGVSGNDYNNCMSETTPCKTIGHAISLAASGDTINAAAATYTENLTISMSLNVIGAGAATTIIDGGYVGTPLTVHGAGSHVSFSKFTIRNGESSGVYNTGVLTLNNAVVTGNNVHVFGGFGTYAYGAGIFNSGTMRINVSTISQNYAQSGNCYCTALGGGIYNRGTLTISNSLINGNTAGGEGLGYGGGIYNAGVLTITNSTIAGNSAKSGGGGIEGGGTISSSTISENSGGGIGGAATLQNSIIANSTSGGNCDGTVTSKGYNLSSDSRVVLPFLNMSADPEDEFFADGITEEIINALAQINELRVVARSSAFSFKGKHIDPRVIGEQLKVRAVLEGSVRRAGNRLRITAQLVNATDGYHLWSERYDRHLQDVFEIQDEIARSIAERLKGHLTR